MCRIPDAEVRAKALDPEASFIVTAPAGAGKTELIVRRFLTLLRNARCMDSIVALTYTKKAAQEMSERVLSALEKARDKVSPKNEKEAELLKIAAEALSNRHIPQEELFSLSSFRISTFHSFCSDILKSFPEDAGVTPNFKIMEAEESSMVFREISEKLISRAMKIGDSELSDAVARKLAGLRENGDALAGQIEELLRQRDRLRFDSIKGETERKEIIDQYLEAEYGEVRKFLAGKNPEYEALARDLDDGVGAIKIPMELPELSIYRRIEWIEIGSVFLNKNSSKVRENFNRPEFDKAFGKKASAGFVRSLGGNVAVKLHELRTLFGNALNPPGENAYSDFGIILDRAKKFVEMTVDEGSLDFIEIELRALKALEWIDGAPSKAIASLTSRIRHILVDEAQDLSDTELAIISKLTEGWMPGKDNTLFFVGDPQQSIYRFRKANVAIFKMLADKEKGLPRESEEPLKLDVLKLTVNFRSEPDIIAFVNGLFDGLFDDREYVDGTAYSPFVHKSGAGIPEAGTLPKYSFANDYREMKEEQAVTVAVFHEKENLVKWFTGRVAELIQKTGDKESIAILAPRRKVFDPYLESLRSNGIALNMVEGSKLMETHGIKVLFNLLKAVVNPSDDVSWLLTLGSPLLDLGPAQLLELSRESGRWSQKLFEGRYFDEDKAASFRKASAGFYKMPGGSALFELWESLDGPALFAGKYGLAGVEDARKFFEILEPLYSLPPVEMIKKMETALETTFEPPDPEAALSVVQAMTIHQAKGLEFDNVFVLGLDDKSTTGDSSKSPFLIERFDCRPNDENRHFDFLLAPFEEKEITYSVLEDIDKKRGEQEFLRKNYVALTRAKKRLFLTGTLTKKHEAKGFMKHVIDMIGREAREDSEVPEPPALKGAAAGRKALEPDDIPVFEPQRQAYEIISASREVEVSEDGGRPVRASEENEEDLRVRGIAVHKLFEGLANNKGLPTEKAVEVWLKEESVSPEEGYARELLEEAAKAWQIEEFRSLTEGAQLIPEWSLEMPGEENKLYLGRLDLVIKKGGEIHIIDYKTGKPGEDKERWIKGKIEEYRPQVKIYKEMIAKMEKIEEEKIKAWILFTRAGELREV
jgi:ATP-dependent helicase/nuclease subunit A